MLSRLVVLELVNGIGWDEGIWKTLIKHNCAGLSRSELHL